mgnify:FL=1
MQFPFFNTFCITLFAFICFGGPDKPLWADVLLTVAFFVIIFSTLQENRYEKEKSKKDLE